MTRRSRVLAVGAAWIAAAPVAAACGLDRSGAEGARDVSATGAPAASVAGAGGAVGSASSTSAAGSTGAGGAGGASTGSGAGGAAVTSGSTAATGPADPVCGNGLTESGEACDDGNAASGDGCSSGCEDESVCPGASIALGSGESITIRGDTAFGSNEHHSFLCSGYGSSSAELVYAVTPSAPGTLTVALVGDYNAHLYVRAVCAVEETEIACDGSDASTLSLPVAPGATYFVIVDGGNSEEGTFTLTLSVGA